MVKRSHIPDTTLWECAKCGFKNPDPFDKCGNCRYDKPTEEKAMISDSEAETSIIEDNTNSTEYDENVYDNSNEGLPPPLPPPPKPRPGLTGLLAKLKMESGLPQRVEIIQKALLKAKQLKETQDRKEFGKKMIAVKKALNKANIISKQKEEGKKILLLKKAFMKGQEIAMNKELGKKIIMLKRARIKAKQLAASNKGELHGEMSDKEEEEGVQISEEEFLSAEDLIIKQLLLLRAWAKASELQENRDMGKKMLAVKKARNNAPKYKQQLEQREFGKKIIAVKKARVRCKQIAEQKEFGRKILAIKRARSKGRSKLVVVTSKDELVEEQLKEGRNDDDTSTIVVDLNNTEGDTPEVEMLKEMVQQQQQVLERQEINMKQSELVISDNSEPGSNDNNVSINTNADEDNNNADEDNTNADEDNNNADEDNNDADDNNNTDEDNEVEKLRKEMEKRDEELRKMREQLEKHEKEKNTNSNNELKSKVNNDKLQLKINDGENDKEKISLETETDAYSTTAVEENNNEEDGGGGEVDSDELFLPNVNDKGDDRGQCAACSNNCVIS